MGFVNKIKNLMGVGDEYEEDYDEMDDYSPYFNSWTISLKTRPRSIKLANRSKDVLAGDRITTSPSAARLSASATASW